MPAPVPAAIVTLPSLPTASAACGAGWEPEVLGASTRISAPALDPNAGSSVPSASYLVTNRSEQTAAPAQVAALELTTIVSFAGPTAIARASFSALRPGRSLVMSRVPK